MVGNTTCKCNEKSSLYIILSLPATTVMIVGQRIGRALGSQQ